MDPITASHLVKDRTQDLQRIAEQVRQERALRPTSAAALEASPSSSAVATSTAPAEAAPQTMNRLAEAPRASSATPATAAGCDLAEPAA